MSDKDIQPDIIKSNMIEQSVEQEQNLQNKECNQQQVSLQSKEKETQCNNINDLEKEQSIQSKPPPILQIDIQRDILDKYTAQSIDPDGKITKYLIQEGVESSESIKNLAAVYLYWEEWSVSGHFIRKFADEHTGKKVKLFFETDQTIEGIHYAIKSMKLQEFAWFFITKEFQKKLPVVQKLTNKQQKLLKYSKIQNESQKKKIEKLILKQGEEEKIRLQNQPKSSKSQNKQLIPQKENQKAEEEEEEEEPQDKYYKIKLIKFQNERIKSTLEDYVKQGEERRINGNSQFSYKNYDEAIKSYQQAFSIISTVPNDMKKNLTEQQKQQIIELQIKYLNNKCVCFIKLKRWVQVEETADKVLSLDKDNFKALFNKGTSLIQLQSYDKALELFEKLTKIDPNNSDLTDIISQIKFKQTYYQNRTYKLKEKNMYRKMFEHYGDDDNDDDNTNEKNQNNNNKDDQNTNNNDQPIETIRKVTKRSI